MPTYSFKCVACGHIHDAFMTISELNTARCARKDESDPTYQVECECGRSPCVQSFVGARNFIHESHSGMYGKYHPGLGEVVLDRAHKNRLLKEQGVIEAADTIGGSRSILGDSDKIEQHIFSPNGKEREAREQRERAQDIQRKGLGWA